uniref:G-protein coupled receptors family 1 profile domain-containing protein n=1 Tax=Periophthalmus magnuspinnatus TaxID=409849 RepID=A0A3B4ADL5_9GOBI
MQVVKMFGVLVMGTIMVQMGQTCGLEMFLARWGQKDSNCELKGPDVKQIPTNISINTKHRCVPLCFCRTIQHNEQLESIEPYAFANLPRLSSVFVSGNAALKKMGAFAFFNLPELTEIHITNAKHLQQMDRVSQRTLLNRNIYFLFLLSEFHDNSYITEVPPNAFRGLCSQTITEIRLSRNSIERVARDAFNGTRMRRLFLGGNTGLTHFSPDAFAGSSQLVVLNISHTALSSVPSSILNSLQKIIAKSAINLRQLPAFTRLAHAELTYPSHCCSFDKMINNRSKKHPLCSHDQVHTDPHFVRVCLSNSTCFPIPDAFNPCEDIMTTVSLRVLIWVISVLALLGNTAVLLVLLGTRAKLTVPRFLMCHLAFADLCMGVYLVVIATVDMFTRGKYYNYAIDWQTGLGCSAAGFFTVFASELSVFTLTAITLERWHTITHALRLDRKLRLRHACFVMTGGWVFALIAALLPTLGVSSYGKVSICLPMDVESILAQIYVVSLLLLNVLAFLCVCACYLSIYLTIRNPSSAHAHADTRIAKRMALLIFTDFLCMAPISFFALSAALKLPLITVTDAKFLLVLFYPINSCSNPFLYAFCTRTFRRDFFVMAARFGVCKTRAQIYRTETSSCQQPAWTSPKSSHIMLYSLANTLHSIDSKQDF